MIRAANISTEMPAAFAPDGDAFVTAETLEVWMGPTHHVCHFVMIPKGYRFDGASIPRLLWSVIGSPFEPDLMVAACVHDWYCEHTADSYQSRVIGDAVFFFLLTEAGVAHWRRVLMYLGVRLASFWFHGRFQK